MAKLSPDTKKKLTAVVNFGKTIFHWSFIPTVLYLGKFCDKHGWICGVTLQSSFTFKRMKMSFYNKKNNFFLCRISSRYRSWYASYYNHEVCFSSVLCIHGIQHY